MKRNLMMFLLALCYVGALTGCNTVEGAGQDVEAAGAAVQEAAQDCKDEGGCDD